MKPREAAERIMREMCQEEEIAWPAGDWVQVDCWGRYQDALLELGDLATDVFAPRASVPDKPFWRGYDPVTGTFTSRGETAPQIAPDSLKQPVEDIVFVQTYDPDPDFLRRTLQWLVRLAGVECKW